jgi:hypothetical protein
MSRKFYIILDGAVMILKPKDKLVGNEKIDSGESQSKTH